MKQRRRQCDKFASREFAYGRRIPRNRSIRFNARGYLSSTGCDFRVFVGFPDFAGSRTIERVGRRHRDVRESAAAARSFRLGFSVALTRVLSIPVNSGGWIPIAYPSHQAMNDDDRRLCSLRNAVQIDDLSINNQLKVGSRNTSVASQREPGAASGIGT